MIFYVNKKTKFLGKLDTDSIPIDIKTNIVCNISTKTNSLQNVYENGKKLYINKFNELNYINEDHNDYYVSKAIERNDIVKMGGDIDFEIFEKETINHKEYKVDSFIYTKETLTQDNAHLFKFDDVIECELTNLVNESNYDMAVYGILDNININESSFKYLIEDLYVTLGIGDNIEIIIDTDTIISSCELLNIPNTLVYINNNIVIDNKCNLSSPSNKLIITILNDTDNDLTIINPCVLYS